MDQINGLKFEDLDKAKGKLIILLDKILLIKDIDLENKYIKFWFLLKPKQNSSYDIVVNNYINRT